MALQTFFDSFTVTTGAIGTTFARTGYGFQPKAFIIWAAGRSDTVDTVGAGHYRLSIGFGVSASVRVGLGSHSQDDAASADADSFSSTTAVIIASIAGASTAGLLDVNSIDSGGITFIIDQVFASAMRVHILAFGGTDITNANAGSITLTTGTGNLGFTEPGFLPSINFFLIAKGNTVLGGLSDSTFCFGWGISASKQGCCLVGSNDAAATMQTLRYANRTNCIATFASNVSAVSARCNFVSQDATGFTLDRVADMAGAVALYLSIAGGQWDSGLLTTLTTLNDIVVSGLAFQPTGLFCLSACQAESADNVAADHAIFTLGGCDSAVVQGAHACSDEDNLATSEVALAIDYNDVYLRPNLADGLDARMKVTTLNATGFTCTMTDAETTAADVLWIAAGSAAGGATEIELMASRQMIVFP